MNEQTLKKDFSWKKYLTVILISEILTFIMVLIIAYNMEELQKLILMPVCLINSLIIFVSSLIGTINYKKYKANGYNNAINIIIAILSSIMIGIGMYGLNLYFDYIFTSFLEEYLLLNTFPTGVLYLVIGIALIFPSFKSKKKA